MDPMLRQAAEMGNIGALYDQMLRKAAENPKLTQAAETGDIGALYELIKADTHVLERIDKIPFVDTPLHVAAQHGQTHFAREMIKLMPSFSRKLNPDGFSPMHLALENGQTELVVRLLTAADADLVRVKGKENMTPFLCAVTMGNSKALVEFLEACPECIKDVTVRDETALHLAVKNNQMEAFTLLLGWLNTSTQGFLYEFVETLVNWKDNDNNTVLHIAAIKEQHEALKMLLQAPALSQAKAKNSEGLTALQIIQKETNVEINMSEEDDTKIQQLKKNAKCSFMRKARLGVVRMRNNMSVEMINTILVVTALFITATYQSALSPPGGVWQDDNSDASTSNITHYTNRFFPGNTSLPCLDEKHYINTTIHYFDNKPFPRESRKAGTTIVTGKTYIFFWLVSVTTLSFSVLITVFLLTRIQFSFYMIFLPLYSFVLSYAVFMTIIAPSAALSLFNLVFMLALNMLFPVSYFLAYSSALAFSFFSYFPFFSKFYQSQIGEELKYKADMLKLLGMDREA